MLSAVFRVVSLVVAAVIGGLVVSWLSNRHDDDKPAANGVQSPVMQAPQGMVAEVSRMPAAARIRLGGYVETRRSLRLAAQAPGRVAYVGGHEGDRVSAGNVVVALDTDSLEPQYRSAWAQLSAEMAATENAQTQLYHHLYGRPTSPLGGPGYAAYERATVPMYNLAQSFMNQFMPGLSNGPGALFGNSMGPMLTQEQAQRNWPALNDARAAYERQLASLAQAQSQVDVLDAQMRDHVSISPWPSMIIKRHVRFGDIVQPGQPLIDMADVDKLDARIEVPETQVANLRMGDAVPVSIRDQNLWASVAQIYPAASGSQHTVTVKLALPPGSMAAPGMYALAWIAQPGGGSPTELAAAIPTSAILYRGSLPVAFVVDSQGLARMRVLRLGDSQGDRTAVLSGLEPGELVVAQPGATLRSGQPITGEGR